MKKYLSYINGLNLIVGLVLLNIFVSFYPFLKLDISQNKIHSLSPVSKQTVKNINDVINVKVFLSQELPPEVKPVANDLKSVLDELSRLNKSKFKVSYVDPLKDNEAQTEAQNLGIQPLQFSSLQSDKFEVQNGYFGLALIYGDKKNVLPVAGDIGNIEYYLISSINKLTSDKPKTVALAIDSETRSNLQYFEKFINQIYTVKVLDLSKDTDIGDDVESIIIVDPKIKIAEKNIEKIKNFVNNKKGLIVFADRFSVDGSMQAVPNEQNGLETLLKENGVELENKIVIDNSSAVANFQTQNGLFPIQYPYWPQIRPENINRSLPLTSGINTLTLNWASPLIISGNSQPLFTSSSDSSAIDNPNSLSPLTLKDLSMTDKSKMVLAAINTTNIKLAVIGDADFIKDQFVVSNRNNMYLALNLVDYFSSDNNLLEIRTKNISLNPILPLEDMEKNMVKIINLLAPVMLLAGTSLVVHLRRNRKNAGWKKDEK